VSSTVVAGRAGAVVGDNLLTRGLLGCAMLI
jgi:hypothetical protein